MVEPLRLCVRTLEAVRGVLFTHSEAENMREFAKAFYTFYFSLPLYNAAREAYRMIKTANLIYVDEKSPEEIRRRNIQRRKEYYETAQGYYNSMLDVLDLAYMTVNHEKIPPNVLKEWVKLITDELSQISKIKRSDKARA